MMPQTIELSTGVQLEYALEGESGKPVVLFVHGVGANLNQFAEQLEAFSADFQVLTLSLRGHGGSSTPASARVSDFTVATLGRDVEALLDNLEIASLHFVGNSLGGLVGYEILNSAPERLLSLTTFGTTAELRSSAVLRKTVSTLTRLLGPRGMSRLVSKTASKDSAVGARVAEMMRKTSRDALVLLLQNIAEYDYTPVLREKNLPLLLIRGEHDHDINKALGSTLKTLADTPRAQVVDLEQAGHFTNLDQPERFNELLRQFLLSHTCAPG